MSSPVRPVPEPTDETALLRADKKALEEVIKQMQCDANVALAEICALRADLRVLQREKDALVVPVQVGSIPAFCLDNIPKDEQLGECLAFIRDLEKREKVLEEYGAREMRHRELLQRQSVNLYIEIDAHKRENNEMRTTIARLVDDTRALLSESATLRERVAEFERASEAWQALFTPAAGHGSEPWAAPFRSQPIYDHERSVDAQWHSSSRVKLPDDFVKACSGSIAQLMRALDPKFDNLVNCERIWHHNITPDMPSDEQCRLAFKVLLENRIGVTQLTWALHEVGRGDLAVWVAYDNGETVAQRKARQAGQAQTSADKPVPSAATTATCIPFEPVTLELLSCKP